MTNETVRDPVPDHNPEAKNEFSAQTTAPLGFQVYDDFDAPRYSLTDYAEKWITPNGLGEMAVNDTRDFSGRCLSLSAVPFQTASSHPRRPWSPPWAWREPDAGGSIGG